MSLFLTRDELYELTARVTASAQVRWLNRQGLRYTLDAEGRPKVLRSHLEQVLGGEDGRRPRPNTKALHRLLDA